jgi:lactoylglutathione lyase
LGVWVYGETFSPGRGQTLAFVLGALVLYTADPCGSGKGEGSAVLSPGASSRGTVRFPLRGRLGRGGHDHAVSLLPQQRDVLDLERSLEFYRKALGLVPVKRKEFPEFTLVFLGDGKTEHLLELTWLRDRKEPPTTWETTKGTWPFGWTTWRRPRLHEAKGCICFENKEMGLYFIEDPDGYWIEILRQKQ